MNRTIVRIAPFPAARIAAIIYFALGLIVMPFLVVPGLFGGGDAESTLPDAIGIPLLYALSAFVGTVLICWLYNWLAPRVGGVELEVEDQPHF